MNAALILLACVVAGIAFSEILKKSKKQRSCTAGRRGKGSKKVRRQDDYKPYTIEEMMLYDWIFDDED